MTVANEMSDNEYLEQNESKLSWANIWGPTNKIKILDNNPWTFHSMISLLYKVTSFTIENDLIWRGGGGGVTKIWIDSFAHSIKFKDNQYIHAQFKVRREVLKFEPS